MYVISSFQNLYNLWNLYHQIVRPRVMIPPKVTVLVLQYLKREKMVKKSIMGFELETF